MASHGERMPGHPSVAAYMRDGATVYVGGVCPTKMDGQAVAGLVGMDMDVVKAQQAARLAARRLLDVLEEACDGDLRRVQCLMQVKGVIRATPDFEDHEAVMDACSDVLATALGRDKGQHARGTAGAASLPGGAPLQLSCIAKVVPPGSDTVSG